MNRETHNLDNNKPLSQFVEGDTLYIQPPGKFGYSYLCSFISLNRGNVTAKIIEVPHVHLKAELGRILTTRAKKCYLWGKDDESWARCHWFQNTTEPAK